MIDQQTNGRSDKIQSSKDRLRIGNSRCLEPLATQPAVEELQAGFGLVHGDHVATSVETHEGEVTVGLDLANPLASVLLVLNDEVAELKRGVLLLARPLKSLGPGLVTEPVADEVSVTSVDEDGDLLEETGHQTVVGLHPVTVEKEVAVDVKVAAVIATNLGAQCLKDIRLVEVISNVAQARVAQVRAVLALAADIIDVLASLLVGSKKSVVAVNGSGNAHPGALAVVARLDQRLATRKSVVHGLAGALIQNSWVTTVTTSHGAVVLVLSQTVSEAVTNKDRLEVDVAVLVRKNLGREDGNVVASVGLSGNVEILGGIFRELLEEQREQGVDIFASGNSVADAGTTVGVSNVDRLIQEDHRGIGVPREIVVDNLDFLVNGARSKLHEETSQRGATGTTIQPKDNGVVLRVVAGLKEP